MATLSLRMSATNPMLALFVRHVLKMMMSFSRPWKASTVFTSIICAFSRGNSLAISSRISLLCRAYGVITATVDRVGEGGVGGGGGGGGGGEETGSC